MVWLVITLMAGAAYLAHMQGLPPDELVMARTLSFQMLMTVFIVGLPAVVVLMLVLAVGALVKPRLYAPNDSPRAD